MTGTRVFTPEPMLVADTMGTALRQKQQLARYLNTAITASRASLDFTRSLFHPGQFCGKITLYLSIYEGLISA